MDKKKEQKGLFFSLSRQTVPKPESFTCLSSVFIVSIYLQTARRKLSQILSDSWSSFRQGRPS